MSNPKLGDLLRESYARDLAAAPRMHPGRTAQCPPLTMFPRALREGWGETYRDHVPACGYCRKVAAMQRRIEREVQISFFNDALDRLIAAKGAADQSLRERFARWRKGSEGAARVILEGARSLSMVLGECSEALLRPNALWQFQPAPVGGGTPRVRGAVRTRGGTRPQSHQVAVESSPVPGAGLARISMHTETRTITVRVEGFPASQARPLVLLIPLKEGAEPQCHELQTFGSDAHLHTADLKAEFSDVAPGDYLIMLEPLAARRRSP